MKHIKTNNKELLLVKVPRDASEFSIVSNMLYTSLGFPFKDKIIHLPSIDYQIVNTLSNLTEDECRELVDWWLIANNEEIKTAYKNYNFTSNLLPYWTTLESFHSLMAVNEVYLMDSEYLILIKK